MKAKAIKATGVHHNCDVVYAEYDEAGWSWIDSLITTSLEDLADIGDQANIKIEIIETTQAFLDNLPNADDI